MKLWMAVSALLASVLLVMLTWNAVQWWRLAGLEARLPGQSEEKPWWYCTTEASGFGMCSLSPPDRIFTNVRVRKQFAAACFFEHRLDVDEVGAVCGPTAEVCEVLHAWRIAVPQVDDVGACESIDIFDVKHGREAARVMTLTVVGSLVAVAAVAWLWPFMWLSLFARRDDGGPR